MDGEEIDILWGPALTDEEISKLINKKIEEIEKNGGHIVGAEPVERIYVKIVGRRFKVEYDEDKYQKWGEGSSL